MGKQHDQPPPFRFRLLCHHSNPDYRGRAGRVSRYYIDCEFDGHNGPLISMAIVRNARESIVILTSETASDPWVVENVIPVLHHDKAQETVFVSPNSVGVMIREFLGDDKWPVIVADSPVDIARFCAALSTAPDGGWASADYPHMTFEVCNVDCYPTTLPGAIQYNAWWDAMALRHVLQSNGSRS